MPLNHMTQTTGNVFRRDVWSKELTRAFEANTVMRDLVSRFDAESKDAKSVTIPRISNLVAYSKVPNTQVTLQNPTEGSDVLNLDKHMHVAFTIEDILKIQQNYQLMSEYIKKGSYGLRKKLDKDLADLVSTFSTNTGTYNATMTTATVLNAVRNLDNVDVPLEDRVWVFKPKTVADLRTLSDYARYDGTGYAGHAATGAVGSAEMNSKKGMVGRLYNSPVYMTTQVPQSGNNISNLYFHKEAIALGIQQDVRCQSSYELPLLANLVVCDISYGVKERRTTAGVEVRS